MIPGEVRVSAGKPRYTTHDTIDVTIYNGLATSIFAQDNHSDCTLVTLLRSVNGSWQVQGSCVNMMPTHHFVEIPMGASTVELLTPGQDDSAGPLWPAGTYRVAFVYVTSPTQGMGTGTEVDSPPFVIA
jgi:hypothetical protein